jgi:hypothetical protein
MSGLFVNEELERMWKEAVRQEKGEVDPALNKLSITQ